MRSYHTSGYGFLIIILLSSTTFIFTRSPSAIPAIFLLFGVVTFDCLVTVVEAIISAIMYYYCCYYYKIVVMSRGVNFVGCCVQACLIQAVRVY